MCLLSHKQWQLLLWVHSLYARLLARFTQQPPWLPTDIPTSSLSPFPGSSSAAQHSFPRGGPKEGGLARRCPGRVSRQPAHTAVRAHLRVTGRRVVGGQRGGGERPHITYICRSTKHEQRPLSDLQRRERGWEYNEPGFRWETITWPRMITPRLT